MGGLPGGGGTAVLSYTRGSCTGEACHQPASLSPRTVPRPLRPSREAKGGGEGEDSRRALTPAKSRGTSAPRRRTVLGLHPRAGPPSARHSGAHVCAYTQSHALLQQCALSPGPKLVGARAAHPFRGLHRVQAARGRCGQRAIQQCGEGGEALTWLWGPEPRLGGGQGHPQLSPDTGDLLFHLSTHPFVSLAPLSAMY